MKLPIALVLTAAGIFASPLQAPLLTSTAESSTVSRHGVPWTDVVSIPNIDKWVLNPAGDAAVIRTSIVDADTGDLSYDLHLLAINAQFTIPTVHHGTANPHTLYTFLTDDTFAALSPVKPGVWELSTHWLNYTSAKDAFPPSIGTSEGVGMIEVDGLPNSLIYAPEAGTLILTTGAMGTGLTLLGLRERDDVWGLSGLPNRPLQDKGLMIEEISASGTTLAFTAYDHSIRPWNSTRSILYSLDLSRPDRLKQVSSGAGGLVSSVALGPTGHIAWLEQEDGNARGQRKPWIWDGEASWQIALDFDLSPVRILFSKNGEAINLLTLHNQEQSLFHIWTPSPSAEPITPVRIPSNGTIHEAVHIGISPLNHSHLIGVMSSVYESHELWVISHSPFDDPTYNYENIRLTFFSEPNLRGNPASAGQRIQFENDVGQTIHGRVFVADLPEGKQAPALFYLHGDEEGGGWHDWWMPYQNPNAFLEAGYAVIQINPTGAEGYSDDFTQARRYQWGGQTITDLKIGLKYCLETYPIDPQSVFAIGYGAFGGWAAHWFQGHNDEWGFKGMIVHDGLVSPRWWALESAAPSKANWEFGPLSYAPESPYTLWDAERFADKWNTPELILCDGQDDADTAPRSQSLAAYNILKSRGIHVELVESTSLYIWQKAIMDFLGKME